MRAVSAADIPRTPFAFDTTQFFIPSTVAKLLDEDVIRERVEAAGFERRAFESTTHRMPPGKTLITCKRYVAGFLVEHMLELSERPKGPPLLDFIEAIGAAFDGIEGKPQKR